MDTVVYTYGNSSWGDQLTNYDGETIVYDAIGNPTQIGRFDATWEGRELVAFRERSELNASAYVSNITYTYNADGIRTSKTVNGVKHEYYLNGSQIVAEVWTENNVEHVLIYIYDESGSPIGLKYRTNAYAADVFDCYFFDKNLQGDVVSVYDANYKMIGTYRYDAWGNQKIFEGYSNNALENKILYTYNPFRYRGYYYDVETGFYYLQSRYYNPEWGRFLNADGYLNANGGIIGFNMYAYCNNNPIMYVDFGGDILGTIIVIGIGVGLILGAYLCPTTDQINSDAEQHYSRNEKNKIELSPEEIIDSYEKQPENMDEYHEYTTGVQGEDAKYNNKYLSPNGGHKEVILFIWEYAR